MTDGTERSLLQAVSRHFPPGPGRRLGIGVSGGGDSLALMHLLAGIAAESGLELYAVTVDHRLRPEARDEAEMVGRQAALLGIDHQILTWEDWDGEGNLSDRARRARYALMADWARARNIPEIAIAHTADDQAETFLMRLSRSAGVDGLSGMAVRREMDGVCIVRPLLGQTRQTLRDYLRGKGIPWAEDPSNQNPHYHRVRVRQTMAELAPLGVTAGSIGETSRNLADARDALDHYTLLEARRLVRIQAGDILFDRVGFRELPQEIARRLLSNALAWVAGGEYPPRRRPLLRAMDVARQGGGITLNGCFITSDARAIRVMREYVAVEAQSAPPGAVWDGRWRLTGPDIADAEVRALGRQGLRECADWRSSGLPGRSLVGYPSLWQGDKLVAAPLAGDPGGWRAELVRGEEDFFASILVH